MDALNYFMSERRLHRELRVQLREFFHNARELHRVENDGELLGLMSPLLQGRVALEANKQWLDRVWYLRAPPNRDDNFNSRMRTFYLAIAKNLVIKPYVTQERIPLGFLYILRRGMVVRMWRFLSAGKVWGEDMILDDPNLIDHSQAVALSYVEVFSLSRHDLEDVVKDYPDALRRIRRAALQMGLQRRLLMYMKRHHNKTIRSYIPLVQARGYESAPLRLTNEQKLDIIIEADPAARMLVSKKGLPEEEEEEDPLGVGRYTGASGSACASEGAEAAGAVAGVLDAAADGADPNAVTAAPSSTFGMPPEGMRQRVLSGADPAREHKGIQQLLEMHKQLSKSLVSIGQVHEAMGKQLQVTLAGLDVRNSSSG